MASLIIGLFSPFFVENRQDEVVARGRDIYLISYVIMNSVVAKMVEVRSVNVQSIGPEH